MRKRLKSLLLTLLLALACLFTATSCENLDIGALLGGESVSQGITLDKTELTLKVGELYQLNVSEVSSEEDSSKDAEKESGKKQNGMKNPFKKDEAEDVVYTWETSNALVATVKDGLVTAVGEGFAVVTVRAGKESYATCTVTVIDESKVNVSVTEVKLNKTELTLCIGKSETLTVEVVPENATIKDITWYSSNTDVVTVENGVLTAVGGGKASVMASSVNGKYAKCEVTVNYSHVPNEAVKENEKAASCTEDGSYDLVSYCKTCGELVNKESVTVTAPGHTPLEAVKENEKAASCTEKGSYDLVSYCDVCGEEISRATETVPTVAHNYVEGKCDSCGKEELKASEGLSYTLSNYKTYYIVSGIGTCTDTDIVIPEKYNGYPVTTIGVQAFYGANITSVTIPDSVTSIGDDAFSYCTSLTSITIPDSVTSIGICAFRGCTGLTQVIVGSNVTEIDDVAFHNCTALRSVYYMGSAENWKNVSAESAGAYFTNSLHYYYSESEPTVKGYFWRYDENGNVAVWENALPEISVGSEGLEYTLDEYGAYYVLTGIGTCTDTDIVIADRYDGLPVKEIQWGAFMDCTDIVSVKIGNNVTSIGSSAFENCSSLKSVIIPDSVTYIELYAFSGLDVVYYRGTPADWNNIRDLVDVPDGHISDLDTIISCYFYSENQPVEIGNFWHYDENGEIAIWDIAEASDVENGSKGLSYALSEDGTYYIVFGIGVCTDTNVVIPNIYKGLPVKQIGYYAFNKASEIKSVTLPEGITIIEGDAFFGCTALTNINIPASVTYISSSAFNGCNSLTSITVSADNENYKDIDGNLYTKDGKTLLRYATGKEDTHFAIPDGVTTIYPYAFYNHSLTSIVIPTSLVNIYMEGFCYSYGDDGIVYYSGTEEKWNNIEIDSYENYWVEEATIYFYSETEPTEEDNFWHYDENGEVAIWGVLETPEDENASKGLEYTLSDDGTYYIVSGIGTCTDTDVVIPEEYEGLPVKEIGNYAFYYCTSLTSVTIPDSVTSIGDGAFESCTSLTSVIIGNSVTSIGNYAFAYCRSLTSVTIPDSVTSIGDDAFYYCTSLTSVTIPDSVTSIGDGAFESCTSLTSVIIGNSVTYIGSSAFSRCTSLASIIIPNSVTYIGSSAFSRCTSLTSIIISDSVTSIGDNAFFHCYKLVEIYNLSSLTITAGSSNYGYVGCYALNVYTNTEGQKKTFETEDGYIFYEDGDVRYLLGYKGDKVELTFPKDCNGKNYAIYEYAFYENNKITKVIIPNSVTSIGNYAFYDCSSLTSITIGNSVTDIGHSAFCRCYKLVEIYNLSSLTITAGSSNYGYVGCYALNVYTNTEGQKKTFETEDGYIFYEDGDVRYLLRYKGDKVELTLPKDCNGKNYAIYKYAFYENNKIIKVIIPNSVTSIGGSAFEDCTSLTSVTLGNSVTSIGDGAFAYCTSLTSIIIPDSVTSIGNSAFESCTSLTSIIIPDSVTSIGNSAFESCTSLTSVYYNGTAEAWNNIEIGYNNYYLSYATRYYYSESEPTEEGNFWHYDENGEVAVW